MTTRLERAIAKLRAMSHEEYESLINRHSGCEDTDVIFPHVNAQSNFTSYIVTFEEAYIASIDELQICNTIYLQNDSQKFGVFFETPNFYNHTVQSETYQNAA